MNKHVARTFAEFARTLGISESTLRRRLHQANYQTTGKLLSPLEQATLRKLLGFDYETNDGTSIQSDQDEPD